MVSEASATIADNSNDDEKSLQLYTLYFVRHTEALHNQLEKEAQASALALAVSQGHDPNSVYSKQAQEDARKSVLESDAIGDPPLSELGFEEARKAKRTLEQLISTYDLPHVQEVWVSPLQRTMQTAATIFPESSNPNLERQCSNTSRSASSPARLPVIRVKKEIEERQTGFACDIHSPLEDVEKRISFRRFHLSSLKLDKSDDGKMLSQSAPPVLCQSAPPLIEEKPMLRERTKKLFNLLAETECRSICVVAHKGYLRELERGPLGKVNAELFKNGEVRVYRLQLDVANGTGDADGDDEGAVHPRGDVGKSSSGPVPVVQLAEKIAGSTIGN